jgi:hypothetical protein
VEEKKERCKLFTSVDEKIKKEEEIPLHFDTYSARIAHFTPHSKHKFKGHFNLSSNVLTGASDQEVHWNFIIGNTIDPYDDAFIEIEIVKTAKWLICLGITSGKTFNESNTLKSPETVSCNLKHASIWKSGDVVLQNPHMSFKQGDVVRMNVNLISDQVSWYKSPKGTAKNWQ